MVYVCFRSLFDGMNFVTLENQAEAWPAAMLIM